jgi:hypothetical protein
MSKPVMVHVEEGKFKAAMAKLDEIRRPKVEYNQDQLQMANKAIEVITDHAIEAAIHLTMGAKEYFKNAK